MPIPSIPSTPTYKYSTFNVKTYGAVGDGVTDDTVAINNTIAAMSAISGSFGAAGILYFPAGRYITQGGHVIASTGKTIVRGDGRYNSIVYKKTGVSNDIFTFNAQSSGIEHLNIDGNRSSGALGDSIVLNAGTCFVNNCLIYNAGGNAINIGKASAAIEVCLTNCKILLALGYGILTQNTGSTDGQWSNLDIGQSGLSGIKLLTGAQNLTNVHTWGNGCEDTSGTDREGINIYSGSNVISGCESETNIGNGIRVATNNGNSITGCSIWGNMSAGIYAFNSRFLTVSGNTIKQNGVNNTGGTSSTAFAGISIDGCSYSTISGNSVYDDAAVLSAGSYGTYTPTNTYIGRATANTTQSYAYAESNSTFKMCVTGNSFPKEYSRNPAAVLLVSDDSMMLANMFGGITVQVVASAATIHPHAYDMVDISGSVNITSISAGAVGRRLILRFPNASPPTIISGSNLLLTGNYTASATYETLSLISDGTNWVETGRTIPVINSLTPITTSAPASLVAASTPAGVIGSLNIPAVSIFNWFTAAQIADVVARTATLDLSTAINAAFAAGVPLYAPSGVYGHNSQLIIPNSGMFSLKGDNWLTEFRAMSSMTAQIWKDGLDVTGATVDPIYISDLYMNANRSANICIRIGASKDAKQSNVKCYNFLTVGFQGGDDSGTQTYTGFYGNYMEHVVCDGNINKANTTVGMPTTGILLTSTSTDNFLIHPAASYVTTAGIDIFGGSNELVHPHSFGSNQYQTGPMYNVRCAAPTSIISPECDNQTIAGIKISSQNVSVTGGYYYWSTGYTPTAWSSGTPVIGQAVPVEVDSGIDTYSIIGGTVRNGNSSNPNVRWLGSARTSRATVWGMSPMFRQAGDKATNTVEKSLGVTRSSSGASFFSLDTPVNNTGLLQYSTSGNSRYDVGLDGTTESGSSAGSNFVINAYSDSAVVTTAAKYSRIFAEWDLAGNIVQTGTANTSTLFNMNTTVAHTGYMQWSTSGNTRYQFGVDGSTETGTGSAGSNLVLNAYSDTGVSTNAMKYWRGAGEWDFYGNIRLGSSGGQLGFYGATTLVSQPTGYGTPTNAAKTASLNGSTATLAQVSATLAALIADLKALGLIAS